MKEFSSIFVPVKINGDPDLIYGGGGGTNYKTESEFVLVFMHFWYSYIADSASSAS